MEILSAVGRSRGFEVKIEKPVRIDMSWYERQKYDPSVAIEVETQEDTIWDNEMVNLLYSAARLKVLLTYIEEKRLSAFLDKMKSFLEHRNTAPVGEEFMAIFVQYHTEKGKDWFDEIKGYLFRTTIEDGKIDISSPQFMGRRGLD